MLTLDVGTMQAGSVIAATPQIASNAAGANAQSLGASFVETIADTADDTVYVWNIDVSEVVETEVATQLLFLGLNVAVATADAVVGGSIYGLEPKNYPAQGSVWTEAN